MGAVVIITTEEWDLAALQALIDGGDFMGLGPVSVAFSATLTTTPTPIPGSVIDLRSTIRGSASYSLTETSNYGVNSTVQLEGSIDGTNWVALPDYFLPLEGASNTNPETGISGGQTIDIGLPWSMISTSTNFPVWCNFIRLSMWDDGVSVHHHWIGTGYGV